MIDERVRNASAGWHATDGLRAQFARDVLRGMALSQKAIPAKYLYDDQGSRLFDEICELEEYYLTRTEIELLARHAPDIAHFVGPHASVLEFGSGSCTKIRLLLNALTAPSAYVPIDISEAHLAAASERLSKDYPGLLVLPVCVDYTHPFKPPEIPGQNKLGFFPGSTIGNFMPGEASRFLEMVAKILEPHALMCVGVDLKKDETTLLRAYDDTRGVTAAFNLNLLARINRELNGSFELDNFVHEARYNADDGRIEMHLVSCLDHGVSVDGHRFTFASGESIHTENSYKYTLREFRELAETAGWQHVANWVDRAELFSLHLLALNAP